MMKSSPNKPSQHHRLVFRREVISVLEAPQLRKVAGGDDDALPCSYFSGCHPTLTDCVDQ